MSKQQKLALLIIFISLLIIAAVIYFFFWQKPIETGVNPDIQINEPSGQLPSSPEPTDITPSDRPRNNIKYDLSQEEEHEINAGDVAKIAEAFAERLGSYSNQSNYANFEDLNIFMTASMREWAVSYVDKMKADNPYNGGYYGITTKAISTKTVSFDDDKGEAEIIVSTQRREVSLENSENTFNQDLRLVFLKDKNQWLVDGAYWLK